MANTSGSNNLKIQLRYSSGNLGISLLAGTLEVTLLYILTDYFLYPAEIAGAALFGLFIADALFNLVVGKINDGLSLRFGVHGILIKVGAPLCILFFTLLYAAPLLKIDSMLLVFLLVALTKFSFTLLTLPHNALLLWVSKDSHNRSRITLFRFLFSTVGFLLVTNGLYYFIPDKNSTSLALLGFGASLIACNAIYWSWWSIKEDVLVSPPTQEKRTTNFFKSLGLLLSDHFLIIVLVVFLIPFINLLFSKSLIYYAEYVLMDAKLSGPILASLIVGHFVGVPLWLRVVKLYCKLTLVVLAFGLIALGASGVFFGTHFTLEFIQASAFVIGVGASGTLSLIWSIAADSIDDICSKQAMSLHSFAFGVLAFISKVSSGLTIFIFSLVLNNTGFVPNELPTTSVQFGIKAINGLVPAFSAIGCIVCILLYKRYREIKTIQ